MGNSHEDEEETLCFIGQIFSSRHMWSPAIVNNDYSPITRPTTAENGCIPTLTIMGLSTNGNDFDQIKIIYLFI